MTNRERARQRQRDAGLAKVGKWTRRAIATGVVASGVLGAGFAHVLPGQAAFAKDDPAPAQPAGPAAAPQPTTAPQSAGQAPHTAAGKNHHRTHRLTPPATAPRRAGSDSPHATSGGS